MASPNPGSSGQGREIGHESSNDESSRQGGPMEEKVPTQHTQAEDRKPPAEKAEKKPFILVRAWKSLGIDKKILIGMAKGAISPVIAVSLLQNRTIAEYYSTQGYLVAIMSILALPIMPRAKFMQTIILHVFAICLGAAVNLLAVWSTIQARLHTEPAPSNGGGSLNARATGAAAVPYNSSQAAVAAIWLSFQVFVINMLRSKYPQLAVTVIVYSIFVVVGMIYAPHFPIVSVGIAFTKRLLLTILSGFGIAFVVHFLVFPVTMRMVVFGEMTGYLGSVRGILRAHQKYVQSIEEGDIFDDDGKGKPKPGSPRAAANALRGLTTGLLALHGKLQMDLPLAKNEIAWGKLGASDLKEIMRLLRFIMIPCTGLISVVDIFFRLTEDHLDSSWPATEKKDTDSIDTEEELHEWQDMIIHDWSILAKSLHKPFGVLIDAMDGGIEHILLVLQLKKPPKEKKTAKKTGSTETDDVEAQGDQVKPGQPGYAAFLEGSISKMIHDKRVVLREWCKLQGMDVSDEFFDNPESAKIRFVRAEDQDAALHGRRQRQLYMVLHMEFLLITAARSIGDLIKFADETAKSGKLNSNRLIIPGRKRFRKWFSSVFASKSDNSQDESHTMNMEPQDKPNDLAKGQGFSARQDPDHLPPENAWERVSHHLRLIPHALQSNHAVFAFRAVCATMSIGIIGFLRPSFDFFIEHRLFWAMIMVSFGMAPTAGQSLFGFILRIFGTFVAVVASFICWYIVDGHAPGIIVFMFFFEMIGVYIILKQPRYLPVGMLLCVTIVLVLGYELIAQKVGIAAVSASGQLYYPIYELAPLRLAIVIVGLFVAWIWTIFPYPISEHGQLRSSLGRSVFLLANFYAIVTETVRVRMRDMGGDPNDKNSPTKMLEKARVRAFSKQVALISGLNNYASFVKFDIPIGGRFPIERYQRIILAVQRVQNYIALVSFASMRFTDLSERQWLRDFRLLMGSAAFTSNDITALLALLSSSIVSGLPLPPYMKVPRPYLLSQHLERLDSDILSVRHIAEPGYAAFAVCQVSTKCIIDELEVLLDNVKALVGELDFSFTAIESMSHTKTGDSSGSDSDPGLITKLTSRAEPPTARERLPGRQDGVDTAMKEIVAEQALNPKDK